MALTRCLGCGRRTRRSRCPACQQALASARAAPWTERRQIPSGWAWGRRRDQVHKRDQVCVRCGSTSTLEVHHRIPLNRGGTNELANLELRCRECHGAVHGRVAGRNPPVETAIPRLL